MDSFFEQIISIKKSRKTWTLYFFIWIGALVLEVLALLLLLSGFPLAFILMAGIVYGAFKLSGTLNVEFEYILTNNTFDVDKIINKASRKRILSFDLGKVTSMEPFKEELLLNKDLKEVVFACNTTAENAYFLTFEKGSKNIDLVFAPCEKMQKAMVKYLPKFISNSLFK